MRIHGPVPAPNPAPQLTSEQTIHHKFHIIYPNEVWKWVWRIAIIILLLCLLFKPAHAQVTNKEGLVPARNYYIGLTAAQPSPCTVGWLYFATDAVAGSNVYGCTTATGIWTLEGGGGGGGSATVNGQTCGTCNVNASAATHSVALNEGNGNAISGATIGTGGRLLIDQGTADPSFNVMSQDCTITSSGVITCTKSNNVSLGVFATATAVVNAQTATYQVLAADFTNLKTISVASGTFTITLVASTGQPANGSYVTIMNYGTGVVTIAVSGQNLNGGATSLSLPASSETAPTFAFIKSDGTNYEGYIGIAPTNVVTAAATLSNNQILVGNGTRGAVSNGASLTLGSTNITGSSSTTAWGINGGTDASTSGSIGTLTVRGGNETGSGGAGSIAGQVYITGGNNSATNVASSAGTLEISPGHSIGATNTGLQGILTIEESYAQGATVTLWNLECFTSTAKTVTDCGASPTNIAGVAMVKSGSVQVTVAQIPSDVPINASAAVTVGDTVCAGTTAGQVTDSGGLAKCVTGVTIGTVIAISGSWFWPSGASFPALSSTLPLVHMVPSFN